MTNSKSSRWLAAALVVIGVFAMGMGTAAAERKRVAILDFEGTKADRFHDDVMKLVKNRYTVIPTDKWNSTAQDLDATKTTDKDIKKVAAKLKIDAVITGKIEKRRDDYLIHLKLRLGRTGEISKPVDTKSSSPRVDGNATTDIKDELVDAIETMDTNRGKVAKTDDDDGDDDAPKTKKPAKAVKKPAKDDDDGDDAKPAQTKKKVVAKKPAADDGGDDDDAAPKHKGFSKHDDDEVGNSKVATAKKKPAPASDDADDDDSKPVAKKPAKKPAAKVTAKADDDDSDTPIATAKPAAKKPAKTDDDSDAAGGDDDAGGGGAKVKAKVAVKSDDDGGGDDGGVDVTKAAPDVIADPVAALSPGQRAVDAVLGVSLTDRRLSFVHAAGLQNPPEGYEGVPVAGAYLDVTVYPFAIGHHRHGVLADLGLVGSYDKVVHITSAVHFDNNGETETANLTTSEQRFSIGAVFRHAFGNSATAPVVLGSLLYGQQNFLVAQTIPGSGGMSSGLPDVTYTMIEPTLGFRLPFGRVGLIADVGLELMRGVGEIGESGEYGAADVLGVDADAGVDISITKNIFVRATGRFETIGYTFKGDGMLDYPGGGSPGNGSPQVSGARDSYFGGTVTLGYAL